MNRLYIALPIVGAFCGYLVGSITNSKVVTEKHQTDERIRGLSHTTSDSGRSKSALPTRTQKDLESEITVTEDHPKSDGIWLPKKFWNRPEFSPIGSDLTVNPETQELLGLSDTEYAEFERVMGDFRATVEEFENKAMVGGSTDEKAVLIIPAWNANNDVLKNSLESDLNRAIGQQKAEYLLEVSRTSFVIATGDFGRVDKVISIDKVSSLDRRETYQATVVVADGASKAVNPAEASVVPTPGMVSQIFNFDEIPSRWRHLLTN